MSARSAKCAPRSRTSSRAKPAAAEIARIETHLALKRSREALQSRNAALAAEVEQRTRAEANAVRLNGILDSRKQALERLVRESGIRKSEIDGLTVSSFSLTLLPILNWPLNNPHALA